MEEKYLQFVYQVWYSNKYQVRREHNLVGKFTTRIRRYLQGHSVDMDGVKIPYELKQDFEPCIKRELC